jgi:hypothetical protein
MPRQTRDYIPEKRRGWQDQGLQEKWDLEKSRPKSLAPSLITKHNT